MEFCNAHGIPHSEFLDWDELDQDKALGFEREKKKVCSRCGTREEEWAAARARGQIAYISQQKVCSGCEALEQEEDNIPKSVKGIKTFLLPYHMVVTD